MVPDAGFDADASVQERRRDLVGTGFVPVHGGEVRQRLPTGDRLPSVLHGRQSPCSRRHPYRDAGALRPHCADPAADVGVLEAVLSVGVLRVDVDGVSAGRDGLGALGCHAGGVGAEGGVLGDVAGSVDADLKHHARDTTGPLEPLRR